MRKMGERHKVSRKTGWNQDQKNSVFVRRATAKKRRKLEKESKRKERLAKRDEVKKKFFDSLYCPTHGHDVKAVPIKNRGVTEVFYLCAKCGQRLLIGDDANDKLRECDDEVSDVRDDNGVPECEDRRE